MPSLRSINQEAGTSFRRWKEVTAVVKEANNPPPVVPMMEAVDCAKCGGTLHAEGNYPNLFRCGDCDTVQKLEAVLPLTPLAPEPVTAAHRGGSQGGRARPPALAGFPPQAQGPRSLPDEGTRFHRCGRLAHCWWAWNFYHV